jgi:hypothetical protein
MGDSFSEKLAKHVFGSRSGHVVARRLGEKEDLRCAPRVNGAGGTCYNSSLYKRLKSVARRECHGNDADLLASANSIDPALAAEARKYIRPKMPAEWRTNPNTWLSNFELDAVMAQYEVAYPEFKYMGTQMSDFMSRSRDGTCVSDLCDRDWMRGDRLYGFIMNMDVHTGRGTHWVGILLDCRVSSQPVCYYYDSLGRPPPRTSNSFFKNCVSRIKGHQARAHFLSHSRYNTKVHQRGNTECGMHALQFLDAMVRGVPFDAYCAAPWDDADAFKKRMKFFS